MNNFFSNQQQGVDKLDPTKVGAPIKLTHAQYKYLSKIDRKHKASSKYFMELTRVQNNKFLIYDDKINIIDITPFARLCIEEYKRTILPVRLSIAAVIVSIVSLIVTSVISVIALALSR